MKTRNITEEDYYKVIEILNDWWGKTDAPFVTSAIFRAFSVQLVL